MSLSLVKATANAGRLKPEIKLAQALSEFEAVLPHDQKAKLHTYRGQSPPSSTDVLRITAEIDRDAIRTRRSRQCVGTRLTNILHSVQQFSTVVDTIVGSSQSQIAGAIWGTVKLSLQVTAILLAFAISSYFDQLSTLFMRIGTTCPRYQDLGHLYPESTRLQSALCEYYTVIVRLCKQAVLFSNKRFWSQLSSSILNPFESEFGGFQQNLENLARDIREEVSLASNRAQQNEAKEMSRFRASFSKKSSDISAREIGDAINWKRKEAELQFLNACSVYNHEKSWKQARKRGNANWIFHDKEYKQWKQENISSTLWCTGILGSGKTVLSANVVEDLKITTSAAVAYFFCRHDEATSLETRTILGSLARQIFDHVKSKDIVDAITEIVPGIIDTDQILHYVMRLLPFNSHRYFLVIDGLDECEEKEAVLLLKCLKQLLMSKHLFQVYCTGRPDILRWAQTVLEPQWNVSMSETSADIEEYINDTLLERLESGSFSVGDSRIILTIQDALLEKAHGMFLWVAFQIDSICSQKSDKAIRAALEDLPKDLPETFNRILRKLQDSSTADPPFGKKIFDLVAAAQRPLTLEELREAINVKPGKTSWDASELNNDMLRSLWDSCGSLIAVDEEHFTIHFAHHSVKQHLLSKPKNSDIIHYHIDMDEADLYFGDVIVTYLHSEIFHRQLEKSKSPILPEARIYPLAILDGSLPRSSVANKMAMKLLKSRQNPGLAISQLNTAAGIASEFKEHIQPAHLFLPYAREYWLLHTKAFKPVKVAGFKLWQRLIDGEVKTIKLPWDPEIWHDFGDKYIEWIIQNEHWALIERSLAKFSETRDYYRGTNSDLLAELLENNAIDTNAQKINFEILFYSASLMTNRSIVLLSLKKGANVNANGGHFGTALQAASYKGHESIVRLLLQNGANVNAEGGYCGTALQAAATTGYQEIAKFLLENGANVNGEGGYYGIALQAAVASGHEEIAKFLLKNGADVNAGGGYYGTALQAASAKGCEEMARLLLSSGANVNAKGGYYGTALQAALASRHEESAKFLLKNGANVNTQGGYYGTALQAASAEGHEEIARLLFCSGANVNAEGGRFGTALQAASIRGHSNIAKFLSENGAFTKRECRGPHHYMGT